jgi:hypothetical protein
MNTRIARSIDSQLSGNVLPKCPPAKTATLPTDAAPRLPRATLSCAVDHVPLETPHTLLSMAITMVMCNQQQQPDPAVTGRQLALVEGTVCAALTSSGS